MDHPNDEQTNVRISCQRQMKVLALASFCAGVAAIIAAGFGWNADASATALLLGAGMFNVATGGMMRVNIWLTEDDEGFLATSYAATSFVIIFSLMLLGLIVGSLLTHPRGLWEYSALV